jgi:hypothetical protein
VKGDGGPVGDTDRWIEARIQIGDDQMKRVVRPTVEHLRDAISAIGSHSGEIVLDFHDATWARKDECGDDLTDLVIVSSGGPDGHVGLSHQERDELCGFDDLGYWLTDPARGDELQGTDLIMLPASNWVTKTTAEQALRYFLANGGRDPSLTWTRGG